MCLLRSFRKSQNMLKSLKKYWNKISSNISHQILSRPKHPSFVVHIYFIVLHWAKKNSDLTNQLTLKPKWLWRENMSSWGLWWWFQTEMWRPLMLVGACLFIQSRKKPTSTSLRSQLSLRDERNRDSLESLVCRDLTYLRPACKIALS